MENSCDMNPQELETPTPENNDGITEVKSQDLLKQQQIKNEQQPLADNQNKNNENKNNPDNEFKLLQTEIEQKLKFLEATVQKKEESKREIGKLEELLKSEASNLYGMYSANDFRVHLQKSHSYLPGIDIAGDLRFFNFLLGKTRIYKGWDAFHCVTCFNFIDAHGQSIQEAVNGCQLLLSQIQDMKSCF